MVNKRRAKLIVNKISLVLLGMSIVPMIFLRRAAPQLTETQLFLILWPSYIGLACSIIGLRTTREF